jgi:glycosyltransferase involved in cell wall biosynthesis
VVTNEYLPDDLIQDAIASSDLTLVAYRHHVGSSGVLIRAAAAGVPVVAQRWGLMGRYVADRRLGLAVDPGNAPALASAIEHAAARTMTPDEWDPVEATRFASEHSLAHFGQALFGECDQPAASR